MKQLLVYLFVVLFSIQSFEQIIIRLNFRLNQDYYASICTNKDKPELECNGCCHLEKQLEQNEEEKSSNEKILVKKVFELIIPNDILDTPRPDLKVMENDYLVYNQFCPSLYYYDIFHPPQI
ncbi:hypothetical protein ACXR6G_19640 [Ancylomarina sp. YFZ004]